VTPLRWAAAARTTLARPTGIALVALFALAGPMLAASPSPSGQVGGDPRSPGQGPGLMGDPAFAILAVLAIGLVATLGTLAWVKLTGGRRRDG
jgi:hypothetical protein